MTVTTEKLTLDAFTSQFAGRMEPVHLICRVSFEERSLALAEALAKQGRVTSTVFYSKRRGEAAEANVSRAKALLGPELIELDVDRPLDVALSIAKALSGISQATGLRDTIIDVTSFRREELLMLFAVLSNLVAGRPCDCVLAYVGAASMGPWMSGQVTGHRSVIGYAGNMRPSLPTKLVVLLGFETSRAASIIENYEPNMLTMGHGRPAESINAELSAENERLFRQLSSQYDQISGTFEFSARDPLKVASELEAAVTDMQGFNVIIAPLHTKLSTLGVGIFARRHPDVQVCYAPVAEYNETAYSKPGESVFVTPLAPLLVD